LTAAAAAAAGEPLLWLGVMVAVAPAAARIAVGGR